MALLFRGLETLEAMVGAVRETGESPPAEFSLAVAFLEANEVLANFDAGEAPKKKALIP